MARKDSDGGVPRPDTLRPSAEGRRVTKYWIPNQVKVVLDTDPVSSAGQAFRRYGSWE